MSIYLDNAATTPLDPEVFEAMTPFLLDDFGNPSSTHSHGRKARAAIESARKKVSELLGCTPGEIIFTSGGTEADNAIIDGAIHTYPIKHLITSTIEHHAVLHTMQHVAKVHARQLHYVNLDDKGCVDLTHLDELLRNFPDALVSLMHGNNEIGNLLPIKETGELCARHKAYFHSDTVQTVGHFNYDLARLHVHGLTAAAHKFHGPKGVGFMYINRTKKLQPFIHGGPQERSMRGGTENVSGIVGLSKALEIAHRDMQAQVSHIKKLKSLMMEQLQKLVPGISFNGNSADMEHSLYTVLNVSLPPSDKNDMLLFNLDLQGISVSGGSACSSGASKGSHVLDALYPASQRGAIRFSFSKFNTVEEIYVAAGKLAECLV